MGVAERGIIGETPNLAERLQSIADPGAVVIAEVREGFSAICLSSRPWDTGSQGRCRSVRAWVVLRTSLSRAASRRYTRVT